MAFEFDEFSLDVDRRELRRTGQPAHLTPKAFQLLELLVERQPAAVSKADIHDRLWPSTFVSDVNLASLVFEIRAALGDDPNQPRYVRTVRGFGYSFEGQVRKPARGTAAPSPAPRRGQCRLIWGNREIGLAEGENVLGRTADAVAWIDQGSVSRRHARVLVQEGQATLEDLGSKNGTWVRGERVSAPTPLGDGDELRLGTVLMKFRVFRDDETQSVPGD